MALAATVADATIARRWAVALLALASEDGVVDRVGDDLERFLTTVGSHGGDREHARAYRLAVEMHRARAALRDAAADFRAGESDVVAENPEERRLRFSFDGATATVHEQRVGRHGSARKKGRL